MCKNIQQVFVAGITTTIHRLGNSGANANGKFQIPQNGSLHHVTGTGHRFGRSRQLVHVKFAGLPHL